MNLSTRRKLVLVLFRAYRLRMRRWTDREELIAAVAFALSQLRPLLRRIVAEKHPNPEDRFNPSTAAAERIVQQLERSGYEIKKKPARRPHSTP